MQYVLTSGLCDWESAFCLLLDRKYILLNLEKLRILLSPKTDKNVDTNQISVGLGFEGAHVQIAVIIASQIYTGTLRKRKLSSEKCHY